MARPWSFHQTADLEPARGDCHWGRTDRFGVIGYVVPADAHFSATILAKPMRSGDTRVELLTVGDGDTERRTVHAGPYVFPSEYEPPVPVVAAVIGGDSLDRLPGQRSLTAALALVPGVRVSGPTGLSLAGSASDEITWLIDGINVTDPVSGTFHPEPAGPSLSPMHGLCGPLTRPVSGSAR